MTYTPTPQVPVVLPDLPDGPAMNAAHDRAVVDLLAYTKLTTSGAIDGRRYLRVEGTSSTVFAVYTGIILAATLKESGLAPKALAADPSTLTLADVAGLPAALSASHWYYVYLKVSGGVVGFEIVDGGSFESPTSAAMPDTSLHYKNASATDLSRRYLGCFPTNGSGVPRWLSMRGGRYVYRTDAPTFTISNDGTGFAPIDLTSVIPPHTDLAEILVVSSTDGTTLDLRTPSAGTHINVARGATATVPVNPWLRTIEARATTGGDCVISVRGFVEG